MKEVVKAGLQEKERRWIAAGTASSHSSLSPLYLYIVWFKIIYRKQIKGQNKYNIDKGERDGLPGIIVMIYLELL